MQALVGVKTDDKQLFKQQSISDQFILISPHGPIDYNYYNNKKHEHKKQTENMSSTYTHPKEPKLSNKIQQNMRTVIFNIFIQILQIIYITWEENK